jgi:serine/threonine protein kinase
MTDHPRPDLATVRGIVEQIARGLQAFHRKAMLHQDLRPDNVMIDRAGTVKLIDFGAAHVDGLAEGTADEGARAIRGALQYTAPEYFSGQGGSAASDLFSLAVITYQMLSSQLPYGMQVTQQVRSPADLNRLRYIPLRSHRPDLPAWLDAVLRKALHPQAARRQEVLSEFIQDLRQPGAQFQAGLHTPLVERDPVVFWRSLSVLLALAVLVLLGLRVMGR